MAGSFLWSIDGDASVGYGKDRALTRFLMGRRANSVTAWCKSFLLAQVEVFNRTGSARSRVLAWLQKHRLDRRHGRVRYRLAVRKLTATWRNRAALGHALASAIRARVAIVRKLAVILHRMWSDLTEFHWGKLRAAQVAA